MRAATTSVPKLTWVGVVQMSSCQDKRECLIFGLTSNHFVTSCHLMFCVFSILPTVSDTLWSWGPWGHGLRPMTHGLLLAQGRFMGWTHQGIPTRMYWHSDLVGLRFGCSFAVF